MKKRLATVTVALALSGTAGAGLATAFATPAGAATPSAVSSPATTTARHPARAWLRAHRRAVAREVVQVSAKTIGITPSTLVSALRSGQSIAQVAQAHGVDVQAVIGALVQAADSRVGQAVGDHTLTQEQGAKIEAALSAAFTKVVDHVRGAHAGSSA
jgi:hypothetical protein